MKRIFFIFISLFFVITISRAEDKEKETLLAQIDKAVAAENWMLADSLTTQILVRWPGDPVNPLLVSNRGMYSFYNGDFASALQRMDEAKNMAPASVTIRNNRARILSELGMIEDAIEEYGEIERMDSTYLNAYLCRGVLQLYSGDLLSAKKDFEHVESLINSDNVKKSQLWEAWNGLATFYYITENPQKAIEFYSKLIKATPEADFYAARAMCHLMLDNLVDASEDITSGIEMEDQNGELYLARAILKRKRYEYAESERDAALAIQLGVNPARVESLVTKVNKQK